MVDFSKAQHLARNEFSGAVSVSQHESLSPTWIDLVPDEKHSIVVIAA